MQRPKVLGWGRNVSDAPSAFPEGGFAEGGLAGLVGICRFAARVFISRRGSGMTEWGRDGSSWQGGSHKFRLW